jgi:hypothetical protein
MSRLDANGWRDLLRVLRSTYGSAGPRPKSPTREFVISSPWLGLVAGYHKVSADSLRWLPMRQFVISKTHLQCISNLKPDAPSITAYDTGDCVELDGPSRPAAFFLSPDKMRARIPLAVWGYRRVSQQPSGSTGFAYATRGMRRGLGLLAFPLIHKLLFPQRVLAVRNGFTVSSLRVRQNRFPSRRREDGLLTRGPVGVPGLALLRKMSAEGSGSAGFQGPQANRVG